MISILTSIGELVFAASEPAGEGPIALGDLPSLILNEGVSIAIVVMFIVGQWTGKIRFVNKAENDQLDRIEHKIDQLGKR